ncbi:hypothetical protein ACFSHT_38160 [Paraburkholderia silviterrae]|uniref:hypothetical protein n=1 Tax=Paraburkholderia silviterrae TaxID=2528715 RepID=UPI001404C5BD|nr:hypothetical protein [Paraburkholderia silviterrae]
MQLLQREELSNLQVVTAGAGASKTPSAVTLTITKANGLNLVITPQAAPAAAS